MRTVTIDSPERAQLRAEVDKLKTDLEAANAAAQAATPAENTRMEHLAQTASHEQLLRFEKVAREFEAESNNVRDLELERERMFADARMHHTVQQATQTPQGREQETAADEQPVCATAEYLSRLRDDVISTRRRIGCRGI